MNGRRDVTAERWQVRTTSGDVYEYWGTVATVYGRALHVTEETTGEEMFWAPGEWVWARTFKPPEDA